MRLICCLLLLCLRAAAGLEVTIRGEDFLFDGQPTLAGRTWNGLRLEGLLPNSRMVQAVFDDLNPATASRHE